MTLMEESFARVETKYLLTLFQTAAMETGLMRLGFEKADFGSPRVQSLYYDTADHALIRASLERPAYKEKLRLRAYGGPGDLTQSFVEIKKKCCGVVYKRRTAMPLQEAMDRAEELYFRGAIRMFRMLKAGMEIGKKTGDKT